MNAWLQTLLGSPLVERFGWVLVHSLWQIALIAALFALAMRLMRRRSANARYVVGCAAMVLMVVWPTATAALMSTDRGGRGHREGRGGRSGSSKVGEGRGQVRRSGSGPKVGVRAHLDVSGCVGRPGATGSLPASALVVRTGHVGVSKRALG